MFMLLRLALAILLLSRQDLVVTCVVSADAEWVDIGVHQYVSIGQPVPLGADPHILAATLPDGIPCGYDGEPTMLFCEAFTAHEWAYHEEPFCP